MARLVVISALPAVRQGDGRVVLTRKFIEGMTSYAEAWDDRVIAVMNEVPEPTQNLDNVAVDPAALPFGVEVLPFELTAVAARVAGAGVVLGGCHHRLHGFTAKCRKMGVPCVHNAEYSVRTRLQIVFCSGEGRLRQLRRAGWLLKEEYFHERNELRGAVGLQANGTPTYEAYRDFTPYPLLYFDNRVSIAEMATDEQLAKANAVRREGRPLRLAFSGRLHTMKGVGELVEVAAALRRRGADFQLEIFGSGPEESALRRDIERHGLSRHVRLCGVLDFHSQLLPHMRDRVDLFVCCHLQGDPSCTYLETAAAGVPIAGYANEAFAGLLRQAPIGWSVPLRRADELAALIARLDRIRGEIAQYAEQALRFARQHSFELTFERRIQHLRSLSR